MSKEPTPEQIAKNPKIVYGAACTWWDSIWNCGKTPPIRARPTGEFHSLPCCPHCGSVLFEVSNIEEWNAGMERFEQAGHPGYIKMMNWAKGKCFKNMAELKSTYTKEVN